MHCSLLSQCMGEGSVHKNKGSRCDVEGCACAGGPRGSSREVKTRRGKTPCHEAARSGETLTYMTYPREHWRSIRTNNPMERIMKEIRRRTNVVGSFPDGYSALMLVCSRLRYITTHSWGVRRYINMNLLSESCGNESEADIA